MNKYIGFKSIEEGFSHKSSGTPCQDAVDVAICDKYVICVAADGHGSEKYIRSKKGSELVVKVAITAVKDFIEKLYDENSSDLLNEFFETSIDSFDVDSVVNADKNQFKLLKSMSSYIVTQWVNEIRTDWDTIECDEKELELFIKNFPNHTPRDVELNITKIYGTTLIIGVITDDFSFIIQCGDGGSCIILEDDEAQIAKDTFDENQMGGMTNSLSASNCLDTFRYFFTKKKVNALILVSDGVLESYGGNDGKDFLLFCEKLYEVYSKDYDKAQQFLDAWMPKLSEKGNEDDVSIAGAFLKDSYDKWQNSRKVEQRVDFKSVSDVIESDTKIHEENIAKLTLGGYDWHLLDSQEGISLVLCETVIDKRAYQTKTDDISWGNSDLREYLNSDFYDSFNDGEKAKIVYPIRSKTDVEDKLFLLSIEEILTYLGSGYLDQNKNNGIWIDDVDNVKRIVKDSTNLAVRWWMRSPCKINNVATIVEDDGRINTRGVYANIISIGVRPAMWVKL